MQPHVDRVDQLAVEKAQRHVAVEMSTGEAESSGELERRDDTAHVDAGERRAGDALEFDGAEVRHAGDAACWRRAHEVVQGFRTIPEEVAVVLGVVAA